MKQPTQKKNPRIKPAKSARPAKAVKHDVHSRRFRRSRARWIIAGSLAIILGIVLISFVSFRPFRDEVDELYYAVYAKYFINPTLDNIATRYKNVAYCGTSNRYQKLDVYSPKQPGGPFPAVIYIHGGGWAVGDKVNNNVKLYGTDMVRSGLALVSINYRLAPASHFPIQNQDAACALSYIQHHASDYNIDPNNIGLWGDSAGGQLVAMTALDPKVKATHTVKAVVEFYGTSDLWAQITHKVNGVPKPDKRSIAYIGSATNKPLADKASPVNANLADAPPFLLFHGTNDQVVPFAQSVAFEKKLQAAGDEATLRSVQNANHNFTAASRPTSNNIKDEMIQFFKQKMPRP